MSRSLLAPIFATAVVFQSPYRGWKRACYVAGVFDQTGKTAVEVFKEIEQTPYDGQLGLPVWDCDYNPSTDERDRGRVNENCVVETRPVLFFGGLPYRLSQFSTVDL